MRWIFHHTDHSGAVRGRQTFLHSRQFLDRQTGIKKSFQRVKAHTERDREPAFCKRVPQLALIAADEKILLHELFQIALALDVPKKRPDRLSRARRARIEKAELAFPLGR